MKHKLLFTALLIPYIAGAQMPSYKTPEVMKDPIVANIIAQQTADNAAAKTTAKKLRLVASSYIAYNQMTDTTHNYYSGERGSDDLSRDHYYDSYNATVYGSVQKLKADTTIRWYAGSQGFVISQRNRYKYDNDNKPVQQTRDDYSKMIYDITYNQQNDYKTIVISDSFGTGVISPSIQRDYYYNGQNELILDSAFSLRNNMPVNKKELTYDANGNLIEANDHSYRQMTSDWINYLKTTYVYDNMNRLIERRRYQDYSFAGTLTNSTIDSFGYTGNNTEYSWHASYYWNSNNSEWVGSEKFEYFYNAQNKVDTYYIDSWDVMNKVWDTLERNVFFYNPEGFIAYSHAYNYMGNGMFEPNPYDKQTFYYEEYGGVGVHDVKGGGKFEMYPNPASDVLNVRTEGMFSGKAIVLSMDGRMMSRKDINASREFSVDVHELPTGNYILQLQNEDGSTMAKKFSK